MRSGTTQARFPDTLTSPDNPAARITGPWIWDHQSPEFAQGIIRYSTSFVIMGKL